MFMSPSRIFPWFTIGALLVLFGTSNYVQAFRLNNDLVRTSNPVNIESQYELHHEYLVRDRRETRRKTTKPPVGVPVTFPGPQIRHYLILRYVL